MLPTAANFNDVALIVDGYSSLSVLSVVTSLTRTIGARKISVINFLDLSLGMIVVSTRNPDPMGAFVSLSAQQTAVQQSTSGHNPYVKWFSPSTFKYYVLVHDVSEGHEFKYVDGFLHYLIVFVVILVCGSTLICSYQVDNILFDQQDQNLEMLHLVCACI